MVFPGISRVGMQLCFDPLKEFKKGKASHIIVLSSLQGFFFLPQAISLPSGAGIGSGRMWNHEHTRIIPLKD